MAIEMVDLPIKDCDFPSLPEGTNLPRDRQIQVALYAPC